VDVGCVDDVGDDGRYVLSDDTGRCIDCNDACDKPVVGKKAVQ